MWHASLHAYCTLTDSSIGLEIAHISPTIAGIGAPTMNPGDLQYSDRRDPKTFARITDVTTDPQEPQHPFDGLRSTTASVDLDTDDLDNALPLPKSLPTSPRRHDTASLRLVETGDRLFDDFVKSARWHFASNLTFNQLNSTPSITQGNTLPLSTQGNLAQEAWLVCWGLK